MNNHMNLEVKNGTITRESLQRHTEALHKEPKVKGKQYEILDNRNKELEEELKNTLDRTDQTDELQEELKEKVKKLKIIQEEML
mmetsp:Transcript_31495/g.27871  ORF Transcript_31495/g.27871 Transcript_31495/m.27871 type:complete len:84 (+) Transcript_31495:559-810(+)